MLTKTRLRRIQYCPGLPDGLPLQHRARPLPPVTPAIKDGYITGVSFAWLVGAAVAYIVGWALLSSGVHNWRWMLASSTVPALLILLLRIGTPESPRWLLSKGRRKEAEAVLKKMLGPDAGLTDLETETESRTR